MATLGSLVVHVGADIASFTTDMNRAAALSKKSAGEMGDMMGKAAAMIGAAALAAGAAVVKMVSDSINAADNMRDMSIAIGTSTEALSQLEFAAEQSGSNLEQIVKGMAKMQSAVADANAGLKTQADAFNALGLSSKELREMSPEDQFKTIADALKGMTNATDRTALAADIFGQKISVGLMPLLLEGSDGIGGMMKQADQLGLTLSTSAANGADEFNDNLNVLQSGATGFSRQLMTELLPALNETISQFINSAKTSNFAADAAKFLSGVFKTLVGAVIVVKNAFDIVAKAIVAFAVIVIETFKALISPITAFVNRIAEAFDELTQGNFKKAAAAMGNITTDIVDQFDSAGRAIAAVATDMAQGAFTDMKEGAEGVGEVFNATADTAREDLVPALTDVGEEANRTALETAALEKETKRLADMYDKIIDRVDPLLALTRDYEQDLSDLDDVAKKYNISADKMAQYQAVINKEFQSAKVDAELYALGIEEIVVTAKRWEDTIPGMSAAMREHAKVTKTEAIGIAAVIEETFKRLDQTFVDFWGNLLRTGKLSMKGLKDLFVDMLAQILHSLVTSRISTALASAFAPGGGGFGSLFSGQQQGGVSAVGMGSAGMAAAIPIIGWVAAAFMANLQFQKAGWGADAFDGTTKNIDLLLTGGSFIGSAQVNKWLESLGLGKGLSNILSGMTIISVFFGRKLPKIIGQSIGGDFGFGGIDINQIFDLKAKGGLFRKDKYSQVIQPISEDMANFFNKIIDSSKEFVTDLARVAGVDIQAQLDAAKFSVDLELDLDPEIAEQQLKDFAAQMASDMFESVLGGFSQGAQDYVGQFEGLELRSEALAKYVSALRLLGDTIMNFQTGAAEAAADYLASAGKNSTDRLRALGDALLDGFLTFEDTPEGLAKVASLVAARYQGEIEYLVAIDILVKNIGASIAAQQQSIREAIDGPKSFGQLMSEAQVLFESLATAGSPEQIASIVASIQNLIGTAFGGVEEDSRRGVGEFLIDFLSQVEAAATARADQLAQMVIDEGVLLREQALMFAETIGAPLDLNIAATDAVNESVNRQTDVIIDVADNRDALLRELIGLIRQGNELVSLRG